MQDPHHHARTIAIVSAEQALKRCLQEHADQMSGEVRTLVEVALSRCEASLSEGA